MPDIRRIIVIFVIAILFTIFVNVLVEAFYPQPEYEDYCLITIPEESDEPRKIARDDVCRGEYDQAREVYNFVVFVVSAVFGLVALFTGLHLPQKKNALHEWVGSGFLLGGLFTIFVGTMRYFGDMGRYMRPAVILVELVLVIYLTYKKLGRK
jgi:TctA family transporter